MENISSHICDYGCGQFSKVYFKYSKKYCCSINVSKCPQIKKINGLKSKGRHPFLGRHHTEETRKILSLKRIGKHNTKESNEKNRISNTGKKMPLRTKEWRERQKEFMLNGGSKTASSFITLDGIKKRVEKIRKKREESGWWVKLEDLPDLKLYTRLVYKYTNISMRNKYTKEELKQRGMKKDKNHKHLDHIFSIHEGFKLGILPQIIGCKSNIKLVDCTYNYSKQSRCDISKEELFKKYKEEIL